MWFSSSLTFDFYFRPILDRVNLHFLSIGLFSVPKAENCLSENSVRNWPEFELLWSFVNYFIIQLQTQYSVVNASSCGLGYVMEANMSGPSQFLLWSRQSPICEVRGTNWTFKKTNFFHSCNRKTVEWMSNCFFSLSSK